MSEFPSGTVTFLFTDVVDSTRLWNLNHAAMQQAMAAHDEIIRSSIDGSGGVLVKGTGDGAFAVFASAFDAVDAAITIRDAIAARAWDSDTEIEVRIGLHTGEAEFRDDDYFGSTVNRTSRVMSAAEPGEVLVSLSTQEVIRDRLQPGLVLADSGERELKGFSRPEHVFALASASADDAPSSGSKPTTAAPLTGDVRQHERGPRSGLLLRRDHRGHHHVTRRMANAARHRTNVIVPLSRYRRNA
jgi:class 3 adenylate cyclase